MAFPHQAKGLERIATLQELRKHVMDDAREHLVTIGVYSPLVLAFALETGLIPEKRYDIANYIRGHFGRQILPRLERTGDTASIARLLDAAKREGIFAPEVAAGFRNRTQPIRDNAALEGYRTNRVEKLSRCRDRAFAASPAFRER